MLDHVACSLQKHRCLRFQKNWAKEKLESSNWTTPYTVNFGDIWLAEPWGLENELTNITNKRLKTREKEKLQSIIKKDWYAAGTEPVIEFDL